MKLQRLKVEHLAGIDRPFELGDLEDGLNIIIGPNGIGKSRVCTAVRALLWHERDVSGDGLMARADFEHQDARWQVVRDGSLHRWQRDGFDATPPTLPGERLEGCFFLGLRDLLDASDAAGRDLASEIRKQMSGGFDLDAVEERFAGALTKHVGRKENRALAAAENEIRKAERGQIELERRERKLESLDDRLAEAERASQRLAAFTTAISLQELRGDHAQRRTELDALPEAQTIRRMHPRDLTVSRDKLARFLCGWLNGPELFSKKYGPIKIPSAHAHLRVGPDEREAWLRCMELAIEEQDYSPEFAEYLIRELRVPAERIVVVSRDPLPPT
jgi:hemoglobin